MKVGSVSSILLHLFARDVLAMKKLEIEKTKPTLIISVLKVDIIKVGLVFSISNFFITKTPLANKWMRKKIPSCSNSALVFTVSIPEMYNFSCF